jgi:hypothetical protein
MRVRWLTQFPLLVPILILLPAAPSAEALQRDGWRVGAQLGGTGLAFFLVEYHFSDNAVCLNVGIFDAFNEPDVSLWFRRYMRIPSWDAAGVVPYVGAGVAGLLNLNRPQDFILMAAAAGGIDWNFWGTMSLCAEVNPLLGFWPLPVHLAVMPSLSLRVGL